MMRVSIDDPDWSVSVTLSISGSYNPDILDDLQRRARLTYTEALEAKEEKQAAALRIDDALEPADARPMSVDDEPITEDE